MASAAAAAARSMQPFRAAAVAPARARSRQTIVARKAAATKQAYICIDCGYIYDGKEPFDKLPGSYRCPVCNAPKRRFRATEAKSRSNDPKAMSGRRAAMAQGQDDGKFDDSDKNFFLVAAVGGAALLGALYLFLNAQTQL